MSASTVKTDFAKSSHTKGESTVFIQEGAEICPHTGQVIIEKSVKVFGMNLITTVIVGVVTVLTLIGTVIYNVDDINAKKMTLLQGTIAIVCGLVYAIFVLKYEKSKK